MAQQGLVLLALGISLVMLFPPTSPLLSGRGAEAERPAKAQAEEGIVPVSLVPPVAEVEAEPKPLPPRVQAKGILMTGYTAGGARFEPLVEMIQRTELNAVVIDIKDESGEISWVPEGDWANLAGAGRPKMRSPAERIKYLKDRGIYVIGRIVCFQDPILSELRPDLAVQHTNGGIWRNEKGLGWVDPSSPEVHRYLFELGKEAIDLGFDEIQLDYVRFPSDGDMSVIWYRHQDLRQKEQVIEDFIASARRELVPQGAYLSADLFGLVTLAEDDMGIGQRLEPIARHVDYVSPMMYPSHYYRGNYGIPDPEADPYRTLALGSADAKRRIQGTQALLRPWIQDFSLRVRYSPIEVRQQITALEEAGVNEWLLWNAANRYTEDALRPARPRS